MKRRDEQAARAAALERENNRWRSWPACPRCGGRQPANGDFVPGTDPADAPLGLCDRCGVPLQPSEAH